MNEEDRLYFGERFSDLDIRLEDLEASDETRLDRIHDRITEISNSLKLEERNMISQAVADKFEDYMKNIEKLHLMVNEFKGVVSIARAVLAERKSFDEERNKFFLEIQEKFMKEIEKVKKTQKDQLESIKFISEEIGSISCFLISKENE